LEGAAYRADLYRLSTLQIAVVDSRTGEYAHQITNGEKLSYIPIPICKLQIVYANAYFVE